MWSNEDYALFGIDQADRNRIECERIIEEQKIEKEKNDN